MFYECSVRPKSRRNLLSFCDNVTNQREEQLTSNCIENTPQTCYLIGNLELLTVLTGPFDGINERSFPCFCLF